MTKSNIIFRWIGVLPCALIASFVVQWLATIVFTVAFKFGYSEESHSLLVLTYTLPSIINALAGFAFVVAGAWCAPEKHTQVAFSLMLLTSIATLMNLSASGYYLNPINYAIIAGRIVGSILGTLKIKNITKVELP